MNNLLDFNKNFEKEIFNKSIDTAIEYCDIGLSQLIENETVKEIPFVKTFISVYKIGLAIKERAFIKKLLIFLKSLHSQQVETEKLNKFKQKFYNDSKFKEAVLENIIVLNERFFEYEKSRILGKLFSSVISEKITYKRYLELCSALDKAHPKCLSSIEIMFNNQKLDTESLSMIISSGLSFESGGYVDPEHKLNQLGKDLYEFGL